MTTGRINQVTTLTGTSCRFTRCGWTPRCRQSTTDRGAQPTRASFFALHRGLRFGSAIRSLVRGLANETACPSSVRLSDARCESEIYKTIGFVYASYTPESIVRDHPPFMGVHYSCVTLSMGTKYCFTCHSVGQYHRDWFSRDRVTIK